MLASMTRESKGGLARARNLTSDERKRIARRAANARWKRPQTIIRERNLLEEFCRKHKVRTLYAFGSVLTDDFTKESDVDLLYEGELKILEQCHAVKELEEIFGRKIDFIRYDVIANGKNRFRCDHIISTAEKICEIKANP